MTNLDLQLGGLRGRGGRCVTEEQDGECERHDANDELHEHEVGHAVHRVVVVATICHSLLSFVLQILKLRVLTYRGLGDEQYRNNLADSISDRTAHGSDGRRHVPLVNRKPD